jgi:formylglycine-generating enzyme required for sulfatase activity
MGAPEEEEESQNRERPQHEVSVAGFFMGRYPVTQAQWRSVAGYKQEELELELDPDPSEFKGDNRPVENVSWDEAKEFCRRLSVKSGREYRLPSEAEWEYACRAGTTTPFHFGETLDAEIANYDAQREYRHLKPVYGDGKKGEYRKETTEVGIFPANEWGLQDMHGNVWEWCEDDWHESYEGAPTDGSAWLEENRTKTERLLRGGSWLSDPGFCRSAYRGHHSRGNRNYLIGFRVLCVSPRAL